MSYTANNERWMGTDHETPTQAPHSSEARFAVWGIAHSTLTVWWGFSVGKGMPVRLIRWVGWKAAGFTAWGFEHHLWPYAVYNKTCLFAFWLEGE